MECAVLCRVLGKWVAASHQQHMAGTTCGQVTLDSSHCTSAPVDQWTSAPVDHYTSAPWITSPMHQCTSVPVHQCITASLHHCTAPLHHYTTAPVHHCTALLCPMGRNERITTQRICKSPFIYTRRCGLLRGPTSISFGELWSLAKSLVCPMGQNKNLCMQFLLL